MPELPPDVEVQRLASKVLARAEYARHRATSLPWLEQLATWLRELLASLQSLAEKQPQLYFVITSGLMLVALLLIAHVVWTISAALRAGPAQPGVSTPASGARDYAEEAAALAAESRYLEAAHAMLLASLAYSAHARLLDLRPEDGNRSVRSKLRGSALPRSLQQQLISLIDRTEASWFGAASGRGSGSAELYAQWQNAYALLRRGGV